MKEVLITSSLLILVVLLARQLFRRKVSQRLMYATWLLVVLRLVIPLQFGQSQYSVTTVTQKIEAQSKPIQQMQEALQEPVAGPSREELYNELLDEYLQQNAAQPEASQPITPEIQEKIETQVDEQIAAPTLSEVLTALWITGMTAMAAWFLTTNLIFLRRARQGAVPFTGQNLPVPVRVSPNVSTPCLVGLFRPVIYLTPACVENEQTLGHVLTHELTHLRHGDHVWSLTRCICLCIYWFNPLVWVAASRSRRDCELACDEGALQKLGEDVRIAYGQTLLAMVSQYNSPAHLINTATSMNETKKQLKERVTFIAKKPKNFLTAAICLILVASMAAGCSFIGSKVSALNHPSNSKGGRNVTYLPVSVKSYDSKGQLQRFSTFVYDDHGQLLSQRHVSPSSDYTTSYTRNEHGLITSVRRQYPNYAEVSNYTYHYNEDGSIASWQLTADSITDERRFVYDDYGRVLWIITKSGNQSGEFYTSCTYTTDDKLIYLDSDTDIEDAKYFSFTYDDQGRLSSYKAGPFRNALIYANIKYWYDDDGHLIEETNANWTPSYSYRYNDGILSDIVCVSKAANADKVTPSYTLDGNGNVKVVSWKDGRRTEYEYVALELSQEDEARLLPYCHITGKAASIVDYRDDILAYFLPRAVPSIKTAEDLY